MKKKVLILASLVIAMTATTVKAQLNVGATTAPITTLDVQGSGYIKTSLGITTTTPYGMLANTNLNYGDVNTFGLNGTGFNWLTTTGAGYAGAFVNGANTGSANGLLVRVSNNASTALDVSYNPAATGGGTSLLRVNSNGFTGIGNSSPARPLDVNAASNPVRFSSLASTSSTTNVLAIDASGDIRSVPVTSLVVTAPSNGPQLTTAGGITITGNESIVLAPSGFTLPVPTAAQIGHSITIVASGASVVLAGSLPFRQPAVTIATILSGNRMTITGVVSSLYASGANCWVITGKDF